MIQLCLIGTILIVMYSSFNVINHRIIQRIVVRNNCFSCHNVVDLSTDSIL